MLQISGATYAGKAVPGKNWRWAVRVQLIPCNGAVTSLSAATVCFFSFEPLLLRSPSCLNLLALFFILRTSLSNPNKLSRKCWRRLKPSGGIPHLLAFGSHHRHCSFCGRLSAYGCAGIVLHLFWKQTDHHQSYCTRCMLTHGSPHVRTQHPLPFFTEHSSTPSLLWFYMMVMIYSHPVSQTHCERKIPSLHHRPKEPQAPSHKHLDV